MTEKTRHIELLFKEHYPVMLKFAVMLLHDKEEARDIVHDVFTRLLDGDIRFDKDKAEAFLLSCVRNSCLNVIRSRNTREQAMRLYLPDESTEGLEERVQALQDGLKDLKPPICLDIVLMHYRDGMTFKEIAAHYGVSETTIYKHLREAMNQLRLTLKQLG